MRFINFALVKLSFCLILGIVCAYHFRDPFFIYLFFFLLVILFGSWVVARRQLFQQSYFGIAAYLSFFLIGMLNYQFRQPEFQPSHFLNSIGPNQSVLIQLKIDELLRPNNYSDRYLARVKQIDSIHVRGKILVSIKRDSNSQRSKIDDVLLIKTVISEIPAPLNPNQFDFRAYMQTQDVYAQVRISTDDILLVRKGRPGLRGKAERFRSRIVRTLEKSRISPEAQSMVQALILGQRRNIDPDLYNSYAAAGAIHILAVSGLHVGIIYLLLLNLFKPLGFHPWGRKLRFVLIVMLLWGFAIITGLSPSVTRAVSMFSFFAIAQVLNRPTNPINTLFLSLFFLLIFNPKWLFQPGFQMSYLAVFFILWIQPQLNELYRPKFYIAKQVWNIFTVSLAAQTGVAPLSLYYFHQFPGLFLLSNLVILPFLGLIVTFGILVILLAILELLPDSLAFAFNQLIGTQNSFVGWVASQESFVFSDLHFSAYQLTGSYIAIVATALLLKRYNIQNLIISLVSIGLCCLLILLDRYQTSDSSLVIFHKNRTTLVGVNLGNELHIFTEDTSKLLPETYPLKSFKIAENLKSYERHPLGNVLRFRSKNLIIVDSSGVFLKEPKAAYVLLRGSPKIHLERLIDSLKPIQIIADGSNYKSYVVRWRESCKTKKLPFHYTGERGAFIIE